MEINTGDSTPIKQSVRRMPLSVSQKVACQIQDMQVRSMQAVGDN